METLREFLGMGVLEFTNFIIKSVFLFFTTIVVSAILIIRYKEIRHEKRQIKLIIDSVKKVEKVEGLLKQYQKTGFRDLEQLAIDVVKICNRKTLIAALFLLFSGLISAQEYSDPFPDSRAPYRFRIYEREVLASKEIEKVDTYWVVKKYNRQWMQGVYAFTGDTTNLVYWGKELELLSCDTNLYLVSPAYYRYDTIYINPTIQGFEAWKKEKGYK